MTSIYDIVQKIESADKMYKEISDSIDTLNGVVNGQSTSEHDTQVLSEVTNTLFRARQITLDYKTELVNALRSIRIEWPPKIELK